MGSLPTWAVWSIVVPLVLLSPVIALLLANPGRGCGGWHGLISPQVYRACSLELPC